MKHIDVGTISHDMSARLAFSCDFVGLAQDDWDAIRDSAAVLGPVLPGFLDGLYDHLLDYDDTRAAFLGAEGNVEEDLIAVLKEHLTRWILRVVEGPTTGIDDLATYLTSVGKKHTHRDGDPARAVPPRYLVLLTSYIQTGILSTLFDLLPDDPGEVRRMGLAWNKFLIVQLELFLKTVAHQWSDWDHPSGEHSGGQQPA